MSSETTREPVAGSALPPLSAGTLLREARRTQGLHIAALAASLKVSPRKLELLETDRYEELPDATFVRALAQAVCRQLRIDAQPVLARLPQGAGQRLERLEGGLNAPFRERPGRPDPDDVHPLSRPIVWIPALLVVGTLAVLFLPFDFRFDQGASGVPAGGAGTTTTTIAPAVDAAEAGGAVAPAAGTQSAPAAVEPTVAPVITPAPSTQSASTTPDAAAPAVPATDGPVVIDARAATWVRAIDANGRTLIARQLAAGERVSLEGDLPMQLTVGNAAGTSVLLRGEVVDLSDAIRRDNVARLQLK